MTEQCYYAVSDSLNLNSMEFVHVLLWLCLLFVYAASSGCRNAHTAAAAAAVAGSATVGAGSAAGLVFWLEANSRIVKIHGSSSLGLFEVGCCCIAWPNAKMHNVHTKCSSSFPQCCQIGAVLFSSSSMEAKKAVKYVNALAPPHPSCSTNNTCIFIERARPYWIGGQIDTHIGE